MAECIFCRIVKGEIPSTKVFENENVVAFLDISPINKGHCLVVPKKHHETFNDVPEKLLKELVLASQKISKAVEKAVDAEGYNILVSNKKVAGQDVFHFHLHVIPRYADDGFGFQWPHKKYEEGEMNSYKEKIAKLL